MNKPSLFQCLFIILHLLLTATPGTAEDSLDGLSRRLIRSLDSLKDDVVLAVLDIHNVDGRDSALGNYLEEKMANVLHGKSGRTVVERSQFEQIIEEWNLGLSGMIADETIHEIGNTIGADVLLVGVLAKVDNQIRVNLRFLDIETGLVLSTIDSNLTESAYLEMYEDILYQKELTDDDYFIGKGRDFDRNQAFLLAIQGLLADITEIDDGDKILDQSFLEYLEYYGEALFTIGSRENCTVRLLRSELSPEKLYAFFFLDAHSASVYYYDDQNYGWNTNPLFQKLVESEYDTYNVPHLYREVSDSFISKNSIEKFEYREDDESGFWVSGNGSNQDWAYMHALLELAMMLETRLEMVSIATIDGRVDFNATFTGPEILEMASKGIIEKHIDEVASGYWASLKYGF